MGYLSPFTYPIMDWIYRLFGPVPTIIYWGLALTILVLGLVIYRTSPDFRLEDILQIIPRTVVSVRKKINKKKLGGTSLIVLGALGFFTFSDQIIVQGSQSSGGGPSLLKCSDLSILACWTPGNSGAVSSTNSTLCTSSLANNLCNLNAPNCSASSNFVVSSGEFECSQPPTDYGLFMKNWFCGQLAVQWTSTGSGFSSSNQALSTNSYDGFMVAAANSTGLLVLVLKPTSCSPFTAAAGACTLFFTFSSKTWAGEDCNFTGVGPLYPYRGYTLQMLNSTAYMVTVVGGDACLYTKTDKAGVDGGYIGTSICGYSQGFNPPAVSSTTVQAFTSFSGQAIAATNSFTVINATYFPLDLVGYTKFQVYITYSDPTQSFLLQFQECLAANGCSAGSANWSPEASNCSFAVSASPVLGTCGYQGLPTINLAPFEVDNRILIGASNPSTVTVFNIGVEFHS